MCIMVNYLFLSWIGFSCMMNIANNNDNSVYLQSQILEAYTNDNLVRISGGNSKYFYGNPVEGGALDVTDHCGIVEYEPAELVVTARCGTRLAELKKVLADAGQMLAFEPPSFSDSATLGGIIATGLSGPRRPYSGSVRDSVLGVQIINGKGEKLDFGGKVIKNVAGYDVSRLMVGALGSLGLVLQVSLKVLPLPQQELTLGVSCSADDALELMNKLSGKPLPLSAAVYINGNVYLRLSGSDAAIDAAVSEIDHDARDEDQSLWQQLTEHSHPFFNISKNLWRLSLLPAAPMLDLPGEWVLDWNGAQRWLKTDVSGSQIREAVNTVSGHASLFCEQKFCEKKFSDKGLSGHSIDKKQMYDDRFHPLAAPLALLHKKLKHAFDPKMILNRNVMYQDANLA